MGKASWVLWDPDFPCWLCGIFGLLGQRLLDGHVVHMLGLHVQFGLIMNLRSMILAAEGCTC
jgi:hypothetical protein